MMIPKFLNAVYTKLNLLEQIYLVNDTDGSYEAYLCKTYNINGIDKTMLKGQLEAHYKLAIDSVLKYIPKSDSSVKDKIDEDNTINFFDQLLLMVEISNWHLYSLPYAVLEYFYKEYQQDRIAVRNLDNLKTSISEALMNYIGKQVNYYENLRNHYCRIRKAIKKELPIKKAMLMKLQEEWEKNNIKSEGNSGEN